MKFLIHLLGGITMQEFDELKDSYDELIEAYKSGYDARNELITALKKEVALLKEMNGIQ